MISPGVCKCRAISDGWTKIDAPMIVPTTIAIAFTRVSARGSSDMVRAVRGNILMNEHAFPCPVGYVPLNRKTGVEKGWTVGYTPRPGRSIKAR